MTGYLSSAYAESLSEFGFPLQLPKCNGWILKREIAGISEYDAMGCYPIFACEDWSRLSADVEDLCGLISLGLVTDPFGDYNPDELKQCFDRVILFKEHHIVDLRRPIDEIVSSHHRYYSRKALQQVSIERCPNPIEFLDDWMKLYSFLIEKRSITGIRRFSRNAFEKQLTISGIVMFRAIYEGVTVGIHLWYEHGKVGYSHLQAVSHKGYLCGAAYALYWAGLEWFSQSRRILDLGSGSGSSISGTSGLNFFKKGFSNEMKPVYFCGKIFDQRKYEEIVAAKAIGPTEYFPAYRKGEFE